MNRRGFLLIRRSGSTWGVPTDAVTGVAVAAGLTRINTEGAFLVADEVVGLAPDLEPRAAGPVFSRLWPQACVGLAIHAQRPVVVIDPHNPPRALRPEEGEGPHGDSHG